MLSWLVSRVVQLGLLTDEGLSVESGGLADETLSLRAARAASRGSRPACILCRTLSWLVQPRHCAKQLSGEPMHPVNYARAAFAIAAAYGAQVEIVRLVIRSLTGAF